MAKKPRTAAQLANDERLRNRKKDAGTEPTTAPKLPEEPTAPLSPVDPRDEMLAKLWAEIESLKANQTKPSPEAALATTMQMQGVQLGAGGIQGIQYKYPVDKGYYPDPTDKLYDEPRLAHLAMRENFDFDWDVEGVTYEAHNITYAEPRFIVELWRKMRDDEGNVIKGRRMFIARLYLHEDELVARIAAEKLGLTGTFTDNADMLNQIRYFRIRDWLLAVFYPEKIKARNQNFTTVVGGKVVEIEDREEFTDAATGIGMADTIRREVQVPNQ